MNNKSWKYSTEQTSSVLIEIITTLGLRLYGLVSDRLCKLLSMFVCMQSACSSTTVEKRVHIILRRNLEKGWTLYSHGQKRLNLNQNLDLEHKCEHSKEAFSVRPVKMSLADIPTGCRWVEKVPGGGWMIGCIHCSHLENLWGQSPPFPLRGFPCCCIKSNHPATVALSPLI